MLHADACKMWVEKLAFITTLSELHEAVQSLGELAWFEFQRAYYEEAGLKPKRRPKPDFTPILAMDADAKADTPLPLLPGNTPLLEEGLHRALPRMPRRVAAFCCMCRPDPRAWRYQESEGERAERQALENLGAWTG